MATNQSSRESDVITTRFGSATIEHGLGKTADQWGVVGGVLTSWRRVALEGSDGLRGDVS